LKSVIALELIGESCHTQSMPWVCEITGIDPQYKYKRVFVRGKKDYSSANSIGSRGIYRYFMLEENHVYEAFERTSWKSSRRYFCRAEQGDVIKMSEEEVLEWLKRG